MNAIPNSLFATDRAQCPDCGAPLKLMDQQAVVDCKYCGGEAVVERRLRTVESHVADAPETTPGPLNTKWVPPHLLQTVQSFSSNCPVCGSLLETDAHHKLLPCPHCGTECKVERRLSRRGPLGAAALEAIEPEQGYNRETVEIVRKLLDAKTPEERFKHAARFEAWVFINKNLARHLDRLLPLMSLGEVPLEMQLGDTLCKLLNEGDVHIRNAVIRAGEAFVFNYNGSQELPFALGLGSGACLKLLVDAACYAADAGALEYACTCLWGCNWIFQRFYPDRPVMGEIVLYRLLYMRGPVQAWALKLAQGQMGLGYRYPTPTLLHFIDDAAHERPELLPAIRKCFYNGIAADDAEYLGRLSFIDELLTDEAKEMAIRQMYDPPENAAAETVRKGVDRLLELRENPGLADAADRALADFVKWGNDAVHPYVQQVIEAQRDALPEEMRRAYERRFPKQTILSPLPVRYWQPEREPPKTPFQLQLDEWDKMWADGLGRAVDARKERMEVYLAAKKALRDSE